MYPTREVSSHRWIRVEVVQDKDEPDELNLIPEGETETMWWPSDCVWRKVS